MSEDSFEKISSQSWLARIGESIKRIAFGVILFVAAFPLILWNENRAIDTAKGLEEGAATVVTVPSAPVDPNNDGRLVHFNGNMTTESMLQDEDFGLSVNAIKLRRTVEMYQWEEQRESKTEKKLGGGTETKTTYRYNKVWSERLIDSASFERASEHENPGSMAYPDRTYIADRVMAGAYLLPSVLVDKLGDYEPLSLTGQPVKLPETGGAPAARAAPVENSATEGAASEAPVEQKGATAVGREKESKKPEPEVETYSVRGQQIFSGSSTAPKIGDLRIGFSVVKPGPISVIARQVGDTLESYHTRTGTAIAMIEPGTLSATNMIKQAEASNTATTWVLRVVSFFLMFVGLTMVLRPLSVLGDVVPIIGSIIGTGTGVVAGVLAFSLTVVTIAIAWLAVRPLLSAGLLAAAVAGFFGIKKLGRKKAPAAVPTGR